jgi:hypothetical protein
MGISMAVLAFGGLLLLVAITGGGFEVKELKVPKVGRTPRLASFVCSLVLLFVGLGLERRPAAAETPAADPKPRTVEVAPPPQAAPPPQVILLTGLPGQFGTAGPAGPAVAPYPPPLQAPPELVSEKLEGKPRVRVTTGSAKERERVPVRQKARKVWNRIKKAAK